MSAPIYNGGLVGAIDEQRRPYIVDDGNWSLQGNATGPGWRAVALLVDGVARFGYMPVAPSRDPFAVAVAEEGVFTRANLLAWRGPALASGSVAEMVLTGGNRYEGWGDTAGEDWMEWGSQDPTDTSKVVLATTGHLPVSGSPPPPADRRLELDPRLPVIKDNTRAEFKLARATYLNWAADNPKEFGKVMGYLAALADGESPEPPVLVTHKGRGIVGLLQAGAATVGRLP